jgi:hypothetical protein
MFGEFSTFSLVCDVDEYVYARGGDLNRLKQWKLEVDTRGKDRGAHLCQVSANYNWWVRDNTTIELHKGDAEGLYIGRLNRYFVDYGLGKYFIVNDEAVRLNLHQGSCNRGSEEVSHEKLGSVLRANHHRHGAFSDPGAIPLFRERKHAESPPSSFESVYGVIAPCFKKLVVQYADLPPADPRELAKAGDVCFSQEQGATYPT